MLSQTRSFAFPPADTDVEMICLRKDPAVAAEYRAEFKHERTPPAVGVLHVPMRNTALQRNRIHTFAYELERARARAVDAVSANEQLRGDPAPVDARSILRDVAQPHPIAKHSSGSRSLLYEKMVEPSSLGRVSDHTSASSSHGPVPAEAQLEVIHGLLHDGKYLHGQLGKGARRYAAAARLIARKPRLVGEQYTRPDIRETVGGGRASWTSAEDDRIEVLHYLAIIRRQALGPDGPPFRPFAGTPRALCRAAITAVSNVVIHTAQRPMA